MPGKIFINYRREDARADARSIYQRLERAFGSRNLFIDVGSIERGRDFTKVLDEHLQHSSVMLVVIGRNWLNAKDERGQRRLDDPRDFVHLEIATALKRGIPVIPILVDGARLPRSTDLPEDLSPLAHYQGLAVAHESFASDMSQLESDVRKHLSAKRGRAYALGAILCLLLAAGMAAWMYWVREPASAPAPTSTNEASKRSDGPLPETLDTTSGKLPPQELGPPPVPPTPAKKGSHETPPSAKVERNLTESPAEQEDRKQFKAALEAGKKGDPKPLQSYLQTCNLCKFRNQATLRLEDLHSYARVRRDNTDDHKAYLARPNTDQLEQPFPLMADAARTRLQELTDAKRREDCNSYEAQTLADRKKARDLQCPRLELWGSTANDTWPWHMDRKVSSVTALVQLSPEAATAARFGKDLAGAVEMMGQLAPCSA